MKGKLATFLARKEWVWIALILPAVWPILRYVRQDPRVLADPVEYFLNYTGFVAISCLCAVLGLTPLRVIFQSEWARALNRHRRLIGDATWVWGTIHLSFYLLYAGSWSVLRDNLGKPFILAGIGGWFILFVLAITSWRRLVRALGGRRWKRIHRFVYLAAALLLFHYAVQEKAGAQVAYWFIGPLIVLEVLRVALPRWRARKAACPAASSR